MSREWGGQSWEDSILWVRGSCFYHWITGSDRNAARGVSTEAFSLYRHNCATHFRHTQSSWQQDPLQPVLGMKLRHVPTLP